MSRPWMPLYIADYLADTMHFSAAEHGAYMLLIMHYWQNGELPNDDARLTRIVRMSDAEWSAARPVIRPKFGDGWRHERIEGEIKEAEKRIEAGKRGGEASARARGSKRQSRPKGEPEADANDESTAPATEVERSGQRFGNDQANDQANDLATVSQPPQPHLPNTDGGGDARARGSGSIRTEAFALAEEIGVIAGFPTKLDWPPGWCGSPLRVETWLAEGWSRETSLATARAVMANKRDGPPDSIKYFEKAIARSMAQQAAPLPVVVVDNSKPQVVHATSQAPADWRRRRDNGHDALRQFDEGLARAEADSGGPAGGQSVQDGVAAGRG